MTSFVAISDTHSLHREIRLPKADVLVHTGDFCGRGNRREVEDFADWLKQQPHKHKVVIPGNHDGFVENDTRAARTIFDAAGARLLINEAVEVEGFKIWGSPITPQFFDWAFMKDRGDQISRVWAEIPDDVDILLTHGPPYGHGDLAPPYRTDAPKVAGCMDLLLRLRQIKNSTAKRPPGAYPRVHIFGHIHDGYGPSRSDEFEGTLFINASTCTERYRPTNQPILFKLEPRHG